MGRLFNQLNENLLFSAFVLLTTSISFAAPLKIGIFGDINGTECQTIYPQNSITAFQKMLSLKKLDHIISTGDAVHGECLSYSKSTPYKTVVQNMWAEYDKQFFTPALKHAPLGLVLSPGNHDAPFITSNSRTTFKTEDLVFRQFWNDNRTRLGVTAIQIPNASDNYPYYWAYQYDRILFVVLQSTTTSSLSNGANQKKWLQALLTSPVALQARARIVYGHVPPYPVLDPSVGSKYDAVLKNEQVGKSTTALMDLLLNNNVDLLMVGHSHAPYPGELTRKSDGKKMTILSMPCGHAPRNLYGKSERSNRGFAYVEIDDNSKITLNIRDWKTGEVIPFSYYPSSLPIQDSKIEYKRISQDRYR